VAFVEPRKSKGFLKALLFSAVQLKRLSRARSTQRRRKRADWREYKEVWRKERYGGERRFEDVLLQAGLEGLLM
jgi:hypothetical protein